MTKTENASLLETVKVLQAEVTLLRQKVASLESKGTATTTAATGASLAGVATQTTRRRMLTKLAAAVGTGALTLAALPTGETQARMITDPIAPDSTHRIGAIVLPPGSPTPVNSPPGSVKYGLVTIDGRAFDLSSLPPSGASVYGSGTTIGVYGVGADFNNSTGVYGSGTTIGVQGVGSDFGNSTGVHGSGSNNGVFGSGGNVGVYGSGTSIGMFGSGNSTGVRGQSDSGVGIDAINIGTVNPALRVLNQTQAGVGVAIEIAAGGLRVKGANIGTNTAAFVHQVTAANTNGNKSEIDNIFCNGNQAALLFVTHNNNPPNQPTIGLNFDFGVFYESSKARWNIYLENGSTPAPGVCFNVLVIIP